MKITESVLHANALQRPSMPFVQQYARGRNGDLYNYNLPDMEEEKLLCI